LVPSRGVLWVGLSTADASVGQPWRRTKGLRDDSRIKQICAVCHVTIARAIGHGMITLYLDCFGSRGKIVPVSQIVYLCAHRDRKINENWSIRVGNLGETFAMIFYKVLPESLTAEHSCMWVSTILPTHCKAEIPSITVEQRHL